jgi:hypothetical protein
MKLVRVFLEKLTVAQAVPLLSYINLIHNLIPYSTTLSQPYWL